MQEGEIIQSLSEEDYYRECCRLAARERASMWQEAGRDALINSPTISIENLHLHKDSAWEDTGNTGSIRSGCGT